MSTTLRPGGNSRAGRKFFVAALAAAIVAEVYHEPLLAELILAVTLVVTVLVLRFQWKGYRKGGHIAAWKRRKWQGTATRREIRRKLSPAAARKRTKATCPELLPSEAPVIIGKAKKQYVADIWSGARMLYAPPQTLKTGLSSCWAGDAPGTLLAFSSRCDQYDHTYLARKSRGPVWTLNADGEGGIPTDFAWSPVDGCDDRATAMRRAGDFMEAAPHDPSGKDAHWDGLSKRMLQYLLKAAALLGEDITAVQAWADNPMQAGQAAAALAEHDPKWGAGLVAMVTQALSDDKYWTAISGGVSQALAWLDDDLMEAVACPPPGEGINLREFIEDGTGTIYMIGADRPNGSLAPYFAAFGSEAFETARSVAEATPGRRLARPFVIVADEAATIAPLPWHRITAVSSGYNIGVTACFQADSQITARWGEHDANTIRTNFTIKVIGPGFTNHAELEALSAICGDVDSWHAGQGDLRKERLFPPERIRLLPDWHALVLHRNARPVKVKVTPVWNRRSYRRAQPCDYPVLLPVPQLALEAPRRDPIAPPYSRPAVTEPVPAAVLAADDEEVPAWPHKPALVSR